MFSFGLNNPAPPASWKPAGSAGDSQEEAVQAPMAWPARAEPLET
jgi:hypothetical protein